MLTMATRQNLYIIHRTIAYVVMAIVTMDDLKENVQH